MSSSGRVVGAGSDSQLCLGVLVVLAAWPSCPPGEESFHRGEGVRGVCREKEGHQRLSVSSLNHGVRLGEKCAVGELSQTLEPLFWFLTKLPASWL